MIFGILLAVLIMALVPITAGAWDLGPDCCRYPADSCCRDLCCAEIVNSYKVSYLARVYIPEINMYAGIWTMVYLEAHNSKEAGELLGLDPGYNCFVSRIIKPRTAVI